jgi:S1-C subfamily serine protease
MPSRLQSTQAAPQTPVTARNAGVLTSIIKVYCVSSSANYILPWQNKPLKEGSGSGFVIDEGDGRRILTNAHVVADHKFVMVRKLGSPMKIIAKVLSVCHESDLAMLVVEEEGFWDESTKALPFGGTPNLQDEVTVIGFPIGGDNVSVTQGVVSRVEPQQYIHGATNLLAIQIDAAINPGNSGGPALRDGKVIGVAFQNLMGASNIGFIIPVPIIEHFLEDSRRNNNKPLGFCSLGISCQTTENGYLQRYLGMTASTESRHQNGILVNKVHTFSSCAGILEKNGMCSLHHTCVTCATLRTRPMICRCGACFGWARGGL